MIDVTRQTAGVVGPDGPVLVRSIVFSEPEPDALPREATLRGLSFGQPPKVRRLRTFEPLVSLIYPVGRT